MPGRKMTIEDVENDMNSTPQKRRLSLEEVESQIGNEPPKKEEFFNLGEELLKGVGKASRFLDSYTGAPIRSGVNALQKGASLKEAASAAGRQFGENPDEAPRYADIAKDAGVPTSYKFNNPLTTNVGQSIVSLGPKEFEVNPAEIAGFGAEVVTDPLNYVGGPIQKALGKAGDVAAPAIEKSADLLSNYLKQKAAERAVKATTGQNISALRKITGSTHASAGDVSKIEQGLRKVGSDILDEGVLGRLDRVEDLAPKLAEARGKYGQKIEDVATSIDTTAPRSVDAKNIANKIADYAATIPATDAGKRLQEKLISEASNFENMGKMGFNEAQSFKNQFKYKPQDADALISNQDATNKIRSIIGQQMDETAGAIAKGGTEASDLASQYGEFKKKYGSFKNAADAASDRVQKNLSNRFVSPSDYGAGIGTGLLAGLSGDGNEDESKLKYLIYAALGGMGNKFLRTRGSSLAATTANSIAKAVENSPGFATKFGNVIMNAASKSPAALVTTHHLLLQNPEYKANFEESQ